MLDICMCGTEAGYPHDPCCPYPLFRGDENAQDAWREAYLVRVHDALARVPQSSGDHADVSSPTPRVVEVAGDQPKRLTLAATSLALAALALMVFALLAQPAGAISPLFSPPPCLPGAICVTATPPGPRAAQTPGAELGDPPTPGPRHYVWIPFTSR